MGGRFWISVVVAAALFLLGGFVVHGKMLHGDYAQLPNLLRSETDAQGYMTWMLLADLLKGLGFTWVYLMGRDPAKPPVGQGLRFGMALAVLATIPTYLIYYAVQPWPGAVVVKQIVYDIVVVLVTGVAVAIINQGRRTA